MTVRFYALWFDAWVGVFIDRDRRRLYIQPLPCLGVRIDWPEAVRPVPASEEE